MTGRVKNKSPREKRRGEADGWRNRHDQKNGGVNKFRSRLLAANWERFWHGEDTLLGDEPEPKPEVELPDISPTTMWQLADAGLIQIEKIEVTFRWKGESQCFTMSVDYSNPKNEQPETVNL